MKNTNIPKHVQVPNSQELEYEKLKIGDRLVYSAIKRYMDKETLTCYPKLETIADDCQCTVNFVKLAIKRLVEIGWITVTRRPGTSSLYTFLRPDKYEMFSDEFFKLDLDYKLKDYYIQLQQYLLKDCINERAYIRYTNNEIAEKLHMSLRTVQKYNLELKRKGIIEECFTSLINPNTGCQIIEKNFNLTTLQQAFLYKLAEHEVAIKETKDDVQTLKNKVAELEKQVKQLTLDRQVTKEFVFVDKEEEVGD